MAERNQTVDGLGAIAALIATVRIPRFAPVARLGAISYSLYLLHGPVGFRVMRTIRQLSDDALTPTLAIVGALAASFAAAALLRRCVDRKFRIARRRMTRRRITQWR